MYQGGTWGDVKSWKGNLDCLFSVFQQHNRRSVDVRGNYRVYYPKTDNLPFSIWFQPSLRYYELIINTLDAKKKCGIIITSLGSGSYIRYYPQGQSVDKTLFLKRNGLTQWILSYDLKKLRIFCDGELFHEEPLPNYNFKIPEGWRTADTFGLFLRFLNYAVMDAKPLFEDGLSRINMIPNKLRITTNKGLATVKGMSETESKMIIFSDKSAWTSFIDGTKNIFTYPYVDVTFKITHRVPIKIDKNLMGQDKPVELVSVINNDQELSLQDNHYIAEAGITYAYNRCTRPSHGFLNVYTMSGNQEDEVHIVCEYQAIGCAMNWDSINLVDENIYDKPNNRIYKCVGNFKQSEAYSAIANRKVSSYVGQLYSEGTTKEIYVCVDAVNNIWKKITS